MRDSIKSKPACCGPKPVPIEEEPKIPPPFVSKLKSRTSVLKNSSDSLESENESKRRDYNKGPSDYDDRSLDNNPENLYIYLKEIERKCNDNCPVKKNFTLDIVKKYFNVLTSKRIDLATIVAVKTIYPDAPYPYAIDAESYTVFQDFFNPLISDLQNGVEIVDSCQGLNFGDSESFEDLDLNADKETLRVMYCEIIVRRNLNDYSFSGCLKADQKILVRDLLRTKCRELFASLSPVTIPNEWIARLKADEPYLFESRAMMNYPKGRLNMAYKDELDCTIGSIINYDDHMQTVLSTNNGKLGHIFNQANKIFNSTVLSKMEFMKHQKYGYLTYSPQYCGTGFVIRLTLRVYFISLMDDVEDLYLKKLSLSFQNFGDQAKGLSILSNKRTLGVTEIETFQNIIEGFRILFELDQELKNTCPSSIIDKTMPVESLISLVSMIYGNQGARTYTKKYLTDTIVHQYDSVPTSFNGLFNHCIRANAFYPKSLFPKACDPDCYSAFSRFFNPIVLEANNCRQFLHNSVPIYGTASKEIRYKFRHQLISGYRVRFSRNLEDYPFPMLMSTGERMEIENKMIDAFSKFPAEIAGLYFKLDNIVEIEQFNLLLDLGLIPKTINPIKRASWVYRDWPQSRGLFVANKNLEHPKNILIILVNEVDHFQVSCINYGGERLDYCYDRAVMVMKQLDSHFGHAFSKKPNYGFLSSNPSNVGCSMRVSAKVYLKYLGSDRVVLNEFCILNNMNYRGKNGSGTAAKDNIFDVSLKLNLNYSEIQILMFFIQRIKDLIIEERRYDHSIPKPGVFEESTEHPAQQPQVYKKMASTVSNATTTASVSSSSTSTSSTDSDVDSKTVDDDTERLTHRSVTSINTNAKNWYR